MRYNKQELLAIATQSSQNFDREGILILKEKQEGFFRRTEGCTARWFRLHGNMLFYLKATEPFSEPIGVIILGRHQVKVQAQDENGHWPFQIVWDNGFSYRMATFLESERILWLKAIQSAPYDNLKGKIIYLNDKLHHKIPVMDIAMWRQQRGIIIDMNEVPLCELAVSCDNLLCDPHGRQPSPQVVVYINYPKGQRVRYSCTEIVDRCSNPYFSKTILFRACDGLTGNTMVRIIVYDVKERVSNTTVLMGYASMQLSTIQEAQKLRIALSMQDNKSVGFITLNGWSLEPSYIGTSPSHSNDRNSVDIPQKVLCHRRSQSLPPRLGVKLKFPSIGTLLKQNFVNSHQVTYRFHSGLGGDITVHEIMAESKICYTMPVQLLEIYIRRENELLQEILSIGEMEGKWKTKQIELAHTHVSLLKHYWHSKRCLQSTPAGLYFKQSSKKDEASLEFAPVNLHLQRMWVHNDTLNKTGFHDIVTVGAFTAHAHKNERTGGLIRLVQQFKDINNTTAAFHSATASKVQAEYENIVAVKRIRDETEALTAEIAGLAENGDTDRIEPILEAVIDKTRMLMSLWEPRVVEEGLSFIVNHKVKESANNGTVKCQAIEKLTQQLYKYTLLNIEFESLDASSSSSSKDTSPTAEEQTLSASVPNISNKHRQTSEDAIRVNQLEFHHDYFKPELVNSERYSSLRIKNRTDEQLPVENRMKRSSKDEFKSSTSLDVPYRQGSFKSLGGDKSPDCRRESFTLIHMKNSRKASATDDEKLMCNDIEEAVAAVVDSIHNVSSSSEQSSASAETLLCLKARMEGLVARMDELSSRLQWAHAALRLRCESPHWARATAALQIRRDTCFAQALTTVTTGLLCWLCSVPNEVVVKVLASGLGPLCGFEGLLSLYDTEKAMWGDMVVAVEDLQTVLFTLVKSSQCPNSSPRVFGSRGALAVHIPISDTLHAKITNKQHLSFTITAVFFNIGVNEKATLAEALNETTPQLQSNTDNYDRLHKYYHKYKKTFPDELLSAARTSSRTKPLEEVIENLQIAVHKKTPKNVEVLHLAALATRLMNGVRFTSCKSAKDRTGMSATLEQSSILTGEYHLAEHELARTLDILRSEGCRRENTHKNIGLRKYAFTKKQVTDLPKEYRPPPGSYGSTQT